MNTATAARDAVHSCAIFKAAVLLAHRYNITIGGQTIGWKTVETGGNIVNAFKSSCVMVSTSNIVGIVGPGLSRECPIITTLASAINIPVISYSATNPDLSVRSDYPTFFRTVPSDAAAVSAIATLFMDYNWTSCIIIYQNDAFGSGGAKAVDEVFYKNGWTVTDTIIFDITTKTIRGDLKSLLLDSSSRIVIVWGMSEYAELILNAALQSDVLGPQFLWILSNSISLDGFNSTSYNQLIGLLTIRAVVGNIADSPVNKTLLSDAYKLWQEYEPESFPGSGNVDYFALFTFDATWTLILALQELCSNTENASLPCVSIVSSSSCFDRHFLGSSSVFDIIRNHSFLGVSGWVEFGSATTNRINGTYYIAQNVQLLSKSLRNAPVAVWSDLNGWSLYNTGSVIVWPGNTLTLPTSYSKIVGTIVNIATVESGPFIWPTYVADQSGVLQKKYVGYIPDLIDRLSTKMGFIPNITVFPETQSYNGLVDFLAQDQFDMVVADLTITAKRREKVTFSTPIFDNSLRIIVRKSLDKDMDLLAYLRPFSSKLWVAVLFTAIYASLLISCFERHANEELQNRSISSLIGLGMWYSVGNIFGYGVEWQVKTAAGRLLTMGLFILSIVLVAAYTANLASDLTLAKSKELLSGVDDLKNGKIPSNRVGIRVGSSIEEYYLREVSSGVRNYLPLNSMNDIYSNLFNGRIDVSIWDSGISEYATSNLYCNLTLVGADFDRSSFGIAYQKHWLYGQQLDTSILSLRESGTLENLRITWFQGRNCDTSFDMSTAMTLESMAGLLLTFGVLSVLAILTFLWTRRAVLKKYLFIIRRSKELLDKEKIFKGRPSRKSTVDYQSDPNYLPPDPIEL